MSDFPNYLDADLRDHDRFVRKLAARLVAKDDADDVAQDAWLVLLSRAKPGEASLRGWLTGIVRTLARANARENSARAQRTPSALPDAEPPANDGRTPENLVAKTELEQRLLAAVLALPEPRRSIVLLRFREDLTSAQIGAKLGLPEGTVRWHLKAALEELRLRLDAEHGGRRDAWAPVVRSLFGFDASTSLTSTLGVTLAVNSKLVTSIVIAAAVVLAFVLSSRVEDTRADSAISAVSEAPGLPAPGDAIAIDRTSIEPPSTPASLAKGRLHIVGRCVDSRGSAIAGVAIALGNFDRSAGGWNEGVREPQTSGEDGRFACDAAFVDGRPREQWLRFTRRDRVPRIVSTLDPHGDQVDLGDVELELGAVVGGTVVDGAGKPVAGASVVADGKEVPREYWPIMGVLDSESPSTTTDSAGSFHFEGLAPGIVFVVAGADDCFFRWSEPLPLAPGDELRNVEIVLENLGDNRIEGVCLDATGAPIPRARLTASWSTRPGSSSSHSVVADAHGHFVDRIVDPVPHSYSLQRDEQIVIAKDVAPGTRNVVLSLEARPMMVLHVRDAERGKPVAEFRASLSQELFHGSWTGGSVKPDPTVPGDARFARPTLPWRLSIEAAGYRYLMLGPFEPDETAPEIVADLVVDETVVPSAQVATIHGIVHGPTGPLPRARIGSFPTTAYEMAGFTVRAIVAGSATPGAWGASGPSGGPIETDEAGRFELSPKNDGKPFLLIAEAEGFGSATAGPFGPGMEPAPDPLVMTLPLPGSIEGRVESDSGTRTAGIVVAASGELGKPRFTRTDSRGAYRFDGLTPGPWQVELRPQSGEAARLDRYASLPANTRIPSNCVVVAGQSTRFDLALRESSPPRISGRVAASTIARSARTVLAFREKDRAAVLSRFASRKYLNLSEWDSQATAQVLPDGTYRLDVDRPAIYRIVLIDKGVGGRGSSRIEVLRDVTAGTNAVDFGTAFGRIEGRIEDRSNSRAVADRVVEWRVLLSPTVLATGTSRAQADGRFALESVPEGAVEVSILDTWQTIDVRAGATATLP